MAIRYFFANPKLKRYAHDAAHATQAHGGGPKIAYHKLVHKKHPGKHVAR